VGGNGVGLVKGLRCSCAAAATLIRIESGIAIVIGCMMLLLRETNRFSNCELRRAAPGSFTRLRTIAFIAGEA
jgi:hypothetical protein